jgi:oxygen-independent coproporphyrinogen-3 oxidase
MTNFDFSTLRNEFEELFRAFNVLPENFNYKIEYSDFSVNITLIYGQIYNTYYKIDPKLDVLGQKRRIKRYAKRDLYRLLCAKCHYSLPYGSLTGVRPTKLFYDLLEEGEYPERTLIEEFDVSLEKAALIRKVTEGQIGIYNTERVKPDLFVNIPFCASRCSYCSFLSAEIGRNRALARQYTDYLIEDIKRAEMIRKRIGQGYRALYVGGGTPTSLEDIDFEKLLANLVEISPEFTVEAGRPDSITENKLRIMKNSGVTRISVNPQSFIPKTLEAIGRSHSVDDIYRAYDDSRRYGFDINMDLIATLPDETIEDFMYSVKEAIKLNPENITIHTLSLKRGSKLKLEEFDNREVFLAQNMVDYASNAMENADYSPYYMYRQKYMSGNLENTGYAHNGKQCVYNVDIMEETHSVIACGAGAISKRVQGDLIERYANVKDIKGYIERFDEIMDKRDALFY